MRDENDTIELITRYKELLDAGAITQEEYDAKKAELLSYRPEPDDYDELPQTYITTDDKRKGCLSRAALWGVLAVMAFLIGLFVIGVTVGGADPFNSCKADLAKDKAETTQPTESDDYNVEAEPTGNILLDAEVQVADVMTGDGSEKIGEYAYITITRDQAQALTEDEGIAFLNERVRGCGYNWFTVTLDDGTGVSYSGGSTLAGTYGQLAADKTVEKELGYITFDGETITYDKAE